MTADTPSRLGGGRVALPIAGPPFERQRSDRIERFRGVSTATGSATLHQLGVRRTFMQGPISRFPGAKVVGSALTLQFMPQREDLVSGVAQEEVEKLSSLWAVLEEVQPGDVLVVQAFGDLYSGCLGEMLVSYFRERGGVGIVIDGCIRDWPRVKKLEVPIWARGATPNYASQTNLFPWAHCVPVACAGVLVLPGDLVVADDDGVVVVPSDLADTVVDTALEREGQESFSRDRIAAGGSLKKYYPLNDEALREYQQATGGERGEPRART